MNDRWQSWGRYPRAAQSVQRLRDRFAPLPACDGSILPRGNGRSYGDVCLNDGATLLHTYGLDHFIEFDAQTGVLRAEAGVLLGDILDLLVPRGWFLPVVPGTRWVTLGGALANDVHGKNHHAAGSFGCHVRAFELLRSDGTRYLCSPQHNPQWFAASIGGLGLTGLVTWVELQLQAVAGPWLEAETVRFDSLGAFFELSARSAQEFEYTVAWVDCAARGQALGRGVFSRANHAQDGAAGRQRRERRWRVPFTPPLPLVNRATTRLFNAWRFRATSATLRARCVHYRDWLFPLDGIGHWNRLYGPRGFVQYQCVLPPEAARDGVRELLQRVAASGQGSPLAVLKEFGDVASPGLLSFPRAGTTLALDFAWQGQATLALLQALDDIVAAAGGAVYPAKDARMSARRFQAYYPQWQRLRDCMDPAFSSGFWRRVTP